jgi:hypothetical protein
MRIQPIRLFIHDIRPRKMTTVSKESCCSHRSDLAPKEAEDQLPSWVLYKCTFTFTGACALAVHRRCSDEQTALLVCPSEWCHTRFAQTTAWTTLITGQRSAAVSRVASTVSCVSRWCRVVSSYRRHTNCRSSQARVPAEFQPYQLNQPWHKHPKHTQATPCQRPETSG